MTSQEMQVLEHLAELRKRLIIIIVAVAVASTAVYFNISYLVEFLSKPLEKFNLQIVYFQITEGFIVRVKISLLAGVLSMLPLIFYQLGAFINPGLTRKEKRIFYGITLIVSVFFLLGTAFGFKFLLPSALSFLVTYGQSYLTPIFSGDKYFSFVMMFSLVVGAAFILPLLIIFLGRLQLVSYKLLKKLRLPALITFLSLQILIIPALDLVSLILVSAPIIILYELSLWIVFFTTDQT